MSKHAIVFVTTSLKRSIKAAGLAAGLGFAGIMLMFGVYLALGIVMALVTGSFTIPALTFTGKQVFGTWLVLWLVMFIVTE